MRSNYNAKARDVFSHFRCGICGFCMILRRFPGPRGVRSFLFNKELPEFSCLLALQGLRFVLELHMKRRSSCNGMVMGEMRGMREPNE